MNLFEETDKEKQRATDGISADSTKRGRRYSKVKTFENPSEEGGCVNLQEIDNFFENQNLFNKLIDFFQKDEMPNSLILEGSFDDNKIDFAFNLCLEIIGLSLKKEKGEIYEQFQKNIIEDILIIKNQDEKQILIDDIRQINEFISIKSYFNNPKFIIIDSIDYLNVNASNCLLKNLEEPSKNVFFILLYNKIEPPLKTILSRCIKFKFKKPSKESFNFYLNKNPINTENCDFYLSLSEDSFFLYQMFIKNCILSFYNKFIQNIKDKNYEEFYKTFNLLFDKIKENNHLSYKKILITKLFSKIFIDIYDKDFALPLYIDKYDQYIKFFQRIFDKHLNLIYYYNLI